MINKMDLNNKAINLRKRLGEDRESTIDIFKLIQKIKNLTIVFYPLGNNISGVCYKGETSHVIAINSDMSVGRQRFSMAHELYHLYFDDSAVNAVSPITIGSGDENEKKADQFASYFLVPSSSLYNMVEDIKEKENKKHLTLEDVIEIEQYYGVSHKAMMYRLLNDGYIKSEQIKDMEVGIIETATKLGYGIDLYQPSPQNKKCIVLGSYITSSEELLEKEIISQGKYESLLLDAFRDDIVYGIDAEEEMPLD
ncbi:ImmA/IrrE family metallo-endopeptidase [Peptostreptococcus anaerobius]|uniref:ImmA/IrrE family metallo-endopeptidase n=1 Tax=Peptostreptococcus anaerobius TaxID=1261 RepID=UPI00254C97CD|nr:ImmA/IrrE family metallo-endopeptidase [Peptostreptococcus anaerobius]MDK8277942.1 ImmA/IrrE family metallo-endopeptidase [Peptostreptococcus anaerobius]